MNITATYDPARQAVRVDVTDAPASPYISRADANGRHPVRPYHTDERYADMGGGAWRAYDREHALVGPVRYVAEAGNPVVMAVAEADMAAAPAGPILTNPVATDPDVSVLQVHGLTGNRTTQSTVHVIIGRAEPVVTHDLPSTRVGTLVLLAADHAEARRLADLALGGPTLLLRQSDHPGLDLYFTTTAAAAVHQGGSYWTVELPYVETARPEGTYATPGAWTFATVATAHDSFVDVFANYLTYEDLEQRRAVQ